MRKDLELLKAVCQEFGIEEKEMFNKSRKRDYLSPRQVYSFFLYYYLNYKVIAIGEMVGKHYTTIILGNRTLKDHLSTNDPITEQVKRIEHKVFGTTECVTRKSIYSKKSKPKIRKDYKRKCILPT